MIKNSVSLPSLYSTLGDMLNIRHPLYQLANKINWVLLEESFSKLYSEKGRPCKPIRLMCGLLILKHLRNVSDESIVEQWSENAYYQREFGIKIYVIREETSIHNLLGELNIRRLI